MLRLTRVELGAGFAVRLWLSDGAVVDADLTRALEQPAFAAITADRRLYQQVRILGTEAGLSWPGGLALDLRAILGDERTVYRQLGDKFMWDSPQGITVIYPDGRVWADGEWVQPAGDAEHGGVDWPAVWAAAADRMAEHWKADRGHLLTEDTLRLMTVLTLEEFGVEPGRLKVEVLAPELAGGKLDLVLDADAAERAVVELKYPRDSKSGISPDTMTFGELLRDFLRVAVVPAGERWVVQLLGDRLVGYLTAACARYGLHWASAPGAFLQLPPAAVAALPKTATQAIGAAAKNGTVSAVCVLAAPVAPELTLYAYRVEELAGLGAAVPTVPVAVTTDYPGNGTTPTTGTAGRTGARQEILDATRAVVTRAGRPEFAIADIVAEMRRRGTRYAESTIRTMLSSHLCADVTGPGIATYADVTRVERGLYRLSAP